MPCPIEQVKAVKFPIYTQSLDFRRDRSEWFINFFENNANICRLAIRSNGVTINYNIYIPLGRHENNVRHNFLAKTFSKSSVTALKSLADVSKFTQKGPVYSCLFAYLASVLNTLYTWLPPVFVSFCPDN